MQALLDSAGSQVTSLQSYLARVEKHRSYSDSASLRQKRIATLHCCSFGILSPSNLKYGHRPLGTKYHSITGGMIAAFRDIAICYFVNLQIRFGRSRRSLHSAFNFLNKSIAEDAEDTTVTATFEQGHWLPCVPGILTIFGLHVQAAESYQRCDHQPQQQLHNTEDNDGDDELTWETWPVPISAPSRRR